MYINKELIERQKTNVKGKIFMIIGGNRVLLKQGVLL